MKQKEMKRLAQQIYQCELIHESPDSSIEEKSCAETRIMQITKQVMSAKDGINTMLEIDELVQDLLNSKNNLRRTINNG